MPDTVGPSGTEISCANGPCRNASLRLWLWKHHLTRKKSRRVQFEDGNFTGHLGNTGKNLGCGAFGENEHHSTFEW